LKGTKAVILPLN